MQSLVRIDSHLNADWYLSDVLCLVVVPSLQDLPDAFFQQNNARPHVACHILTFFDMQGIRLLSWPVWSPDLLSIENIRVMGCGETGLLLLSI